MLAAISLPPPLHVRLSSESDAKAEESVDSQCKLAQLLSGPQQKLGESAALLAQSANLRVVTSQ